MEDVPTRTFKATCHCTSTSLSFTVAQSSLPLPVHFCHCTSCRSTHGMLSTIHAPIPEPQIDASTCTEYKSSGRVTRWFCSTCGAHIFDRATDGEKKSWTVSVALVDAEESVWRFEKHIFLRDTRDGGIAKYLREVNGRGMKCWNERPVDDPRFEEKGDWIWPENVKGLEGGEDEKEDAGPPKAGPDASERAHADADALPPGQSHPDTHSQIGFQVQTPKPQPRSLQLRCHCAGISFSLARPTGPDSFPSDDPTLIPTDTTRFFAVYDVCTSCRHCNSTFSTPWIFVPRSLLVDYPSNDLPGTAKMYSSSEQIKRTFCGTCGATVALVYAGRPNVIDVAAGLICVGDGGNEAGGVRAEEWVEWRTGRVAWEEDACWKGVFGGFKRALAGEAEE